MKLAQPNPSREEDLQDLYARLRDLRVRATDLQLSDAVTLLHLTMLRVLTEIGPEDAGHAELPEALNEAPGPIVVAPAAPTLTAPALTRRELQCLQFLADGVVPKNIAASLKLSEAAVRLYLQRARRRLGCVTTLQAAVRAVALGLIKPG